MSQETLFYLVIPERYAENLPCVYLSENRIFKTSLLISPILDNFIYDEQPSLILEEQHHNEA